MAKRLFDLTFAAVSLLILAPALVTIAILIKLEDRGPVFYRGVRAGVLGQPFRILKFRTMVANAEVIGGSSTADDDPRITRIGRLLRKYKLDELPQLFSVLVGDMSIVGPRPEIQRYVDTYTDQEKTILSVRPGIVDWATLWNADEGAILSGRADPDRIYEEEIRPTKIKLQLKYVLDHSFLTDLRILFLTLAIVLLRREPEAVRELRQV